jgi:hypothetical protein
MKLQFSTRTLLVLLTTLAVAIFFFVEPSYHLKNRCKDCVRHCPTAPSIER